MSARTRLTTGVAAVALVLTGVPAAVAGPDDPAVPPTQAGTPDEEVDFHGFVDPAEGAGATADEDTPKDGGDGAVGEANVDPSPDVPGEDSTTSAATATEPDLTVSDVSPDATQLQRQLDESDSDQLRVIITLGDTIKPLGSLDAAGRDAQQAAIGASLDALTGSLAETGSRQVHRYRAIPAAVWTIDQAGLDSLLANPNVAAITVDEPVMQTQLDSSSDVIDSDLLQAAGVDGAGYEGEPVGRYVVGIVDSGVDNDHNAFSGRIVSEACFSAASDCPGGTTQAYGTNAGESCTHSSDCDHGTHVAGIAAGGLHSGGHEGVADRAGIVAINASSDNLGSPRATFYFSDLDRAMDRLIDLKNGSQPDIVAANFSIGTVSTYADGSECDNLVPATTAMFGQLRSAGIAPVVAAGNSGDKSQMSYPGCVSHVIAVGATTDSDVPASYSNASPGLDLWAPGSSITAPVPTGNSLGTKSGTSMAAPHVTGAFALVAECIAADSVNGRESLLQHNGVGITVNGNTRTRINVLEAATSTVNNNDFANPETIPAAAGIDDYDWNVCADAEPGEPGPGAIGNSLWWQWTPSSTGTATITTNDGLNNTTFDTQLSLFTGNSLGSLQLVAFDEDGGTGLRSYLTAPVNAGTTYRIRVDGFGTANGELNLQVDLGAPPTCHGKAATIVGTPGDDTINGTGGDDVIMAFAGNDKVFANGGDDEVCMGDGADVAHGNAGDDRLWGGPGADRLFGGFGHDWVVGNAGFGDTDDLGDVLFGGPGHDLVDGWVGNDVITPDWGNDTVYGAAGIDRVVFKHPVTADLVDQSASGEGSDALFGVEQLTGSPGDDVLRGDGGPNRIVGRGGHDLLIGRGANDVLYGHAGNDRIRGSQGDDTIIGHGGADRLFGGPGNDLIAGRVGPDRLEGHGGNDVMRGHAGNDTLIGHGGDDAMFGGGGRDTLRGRYGDDTLRGNDGNDVLAGNQGSDDLRGGRHHDRCWGGSQVDTAAGCEVTGGIP